MGTNTQSIHDRKVKHIELAQLDESQMSWNPFDDYDLPYTALPEIALSDVDTSTELLGRKINQPLIIASMTGGSQHAEEINKNLAIAAQEMQVGLGVGSQRIMLRDELAAKSFKHIRKYAPDIALFGNIGAVQLNYGVTVDMIRSLIDEIQADALFLHLNPLQEAIQPEGDTDFSGLLNKIEQLVTSLDVPVIAKEVGHGIDGETAYKLLQVGVAGIDVAGAGGTSWAWIEARRQQEKVYEDWFKELGVSTDMCLNEVAKLKNEFDFSLIASGGVRSPIDGLKGLLMGADYYSAARPFLQAAITSSDEVIRVLRNWQEGLRIALFSCGIATLD